MGEGSDQPPETTDESDGEPPRHQPQDHTFNGGNSVCVGYDNDSLLARGGPKRLAIRASPFGNLSFASDSTLLESRSLQPFRVPWS